LEGGDFFPAGVDLAFLGIGLRSNMEACQYLLDKDLFGTQRVAVVKDFFDQHQQRMHLDTVFNIIAPKVCLMLKDIQGKDSPLRRLVDEYKKNERGEYFLARHDIEFLQYVQEQGYTVITLTNEMQIAYGCNGLNLGNNTLITVDRMTAKFIARSNQFRGKIICVDFSNNTNMFGSVHCCSQVISRRAPTQTQIPSRNSLEIPLSMPGSSSLPAVVVEHPKPFVALPANVAQKYLMIAPNNFDVNHATAQDNLLMASSHERFKQKIHQKGQGRRDVHATLMTEFAALHHVLTVKTGAEVHLFTHEVFHQSPDALFVADWFSTHREGDFGSNSKSGEKGIVLFPMKAPTRRHERRHDIVQFLHKTYNQVVNLAPCEVGKIEALDSIIDSPSVADGICKPLEGSSFVTDRDTRLAFAGRTCTRLNVETFQLWAKKTGYTPILFDLHAESTLPHAALLRCAHHTRTFLAIFSTFSFVCTEAISPGDRERVVAALKKGSTNASSSSNTEKTVIDFTLAQCHFLAITGSFEVFSREGKSVLIISKTAHDSFTQNQLDTLQSLGTTIEVVGLPEIEQLGGGSVSGVIGPLF
jgi:hypothetical protein